MRRILVSLMSLGLAACAAGGTHTLDSGLEAEDVDAEVFDFPDARVRADARQFPDAAVDPIDGATPKPDAAPKPDAMQAPPPDASPPADAMAPPPVGILANSDLAVSNFDTSNVLDDCTAAAPWGKSWGINGFTYDGVNNEIAFARFNVTDGKGYVYGKEADAQWGVVQFVQGDVWGGTFCGAAPWNVFTPVAVNGKTVTASLKVYRDTDTLSTLSDSWVSMAVNIWLTSPDMPKAGDDKINKKPLVLDFLFHIECNTFEGCNTVASEEETDSYHWQKFVQQAPSKNWTTINLDVTAAINDAVTKFGLQAAKSTLKIYEADVIIDLRNAEGAMTFDDFTINVSP